MSFGIEFPGGQTVIRDRRALVPDKFNPERQTRTGTWGSPVALERTYLDPTSSAALASGTRSEILSTARLFAEDPNVDVIAGDRIRVGGTVEDLDTGVAYIVDARPAAVVNPFTGDAPPLEIPLTLVEG